MTPPLSLAVFNFETGTISITDELSIVRLYSSQESGRTEKCAITGIVNFRDDMDFWVGFHAAHVFPLSQGQRFVDSGFSPGITNREESATRELILVRLDCLCSPISMKSLILFCFSINPDDNYKIVSFVPDVFGRSVRDELLRWHFHQAVLTNMRGAGEPGFEIDFPPGTDMVGEILNGPQAAKRMETVLFLRLNRLAWQTSLSH
ncbi:hypothetical protein V1515DRAFT_626092 [Lipomyces mesembrius]